MTDHLHAPPSHSPANLQWTGERMVPARVDKQTFWEHVERYRFACGYVKNKTVLDIACGEGYGSAAMLAAGAKDVTGVDLSPDACAHAKQRYGIDARVGNAEQIPLEDRSLDLIVSFETIEHVPTPGLFIAECRRVLKPGGQLIISTPNKSEYQKTTNENPYHSSEVEFAEFKELLLKTFKQARFFGQYLPPPWHLRTRGVGRASSYLQRLFVPELHQPLAPEMRASVQDHILRPLRPLEKALSPWVVQAADDAVLTKSRYIVAICD